MFFFNMCFHFFSILRFLHKFRIERKIGKKGLEIVSQDLIEKKPNSDLLNFFNGPHAARIKETNMSNIPESLVNDESLCGLKRTPWVLVGQVTQYKHKRRDKKRMSTFKNSLYTTVRALEGVAKQCLLECGSSSHTIWKGGKDQWAIDKDTILSRIRDGISRFPVVGLDSEGNGSWYQLSWVGPEGLECLVLGLNFFPVLYGLNLKRSLII